MKKLSGAAIRSLFLEYFASKGHEIVKSASLIPGDDPTLMFTNAGMVPFKRVFLGEEKRPYTRAASCQKCVRAGGKHNDLENVGYTARHHTFFEMLGNFSFGDYFKEGAISFAWEFLTKIIGLPQERLWVTVFRDDDEAAQLWPKVAGIDPKRVVRLGEKDNFWAMGDTGPCGPCSEILIDQGKHVGCRRPDCKVGCDCDRFLELWNLVFMQYSRDESGVLTPLPKQNIDTGMGLERVAAVLQGKLSNFDSDIFSGMISRIGEMAGCGYGTDPQKDVAMRVIADHARTCAFLASEGVMPSNEGRGYVLRRIIRRAVRYGRKLGLQGSFLPAVMEKVASEVVEVYPELLENLATASKVVSYEEGRFRETLDNGMNILNEEISHLKARSDSIIQGWFAFRLYDTYGFPIDILQDVAKEEGLILDRAGFEREMSEQKARSKQHHKDARLEGTSKIYLELAEQGLKTTFRGYETLECHGRILALIAGDAPCKRASKGWQGSLIVDETPFYAESGGQIGDTGLIVSVNGAEARVTGTVKRGDFTVHEVEVTAGEFCLDNPVNLHVTTGKRADTARNHTATHLLHASLRKVLGEHVHQAGSLVTDARLRFDFTHFSGLSKDVIKHLERMVNETICSDVELSTEIISHKEAIEKGAMALFGEKYGDVVRMVQVGDVSCELCGGTHVKRTGEIGLFKIVSEASVASGIRRIEAVTGSHALSWLHEMEDTMQRTLDQLRCTLPELPERTVKLTEKIKGLEKELEKAAAKGTGIDLDAILAKKQDVNGVQVVTYEASVADPKLLRDLGDRLRDRLGSGVIVLGAKESAKATLLVMVTKDLSTRLKAGEIVKPLAEIIGGTGGGRPEMAQAGGSNPDALAQALKTVPEVIGRF